MNKYDLPLFDGKPLEFSLKPFEIKKSDQEKIESSLARILKEVEDFSTQALKDPKLLKELGLPQDLSPEPTPLGLHIPFARFDFLFDGESDFKILELNTDGTSGYNISEWLGRKAELNIESDPCFDLSNRLLKALQEHSPKAPEIILVDFPEVKTAWEQNDLIARWQKKVKCHRANPDFRSWKDGALAYRRVLSWQLRSQSQSCEPFLKDWREKKITVVGGWSSDVGMSKAWPAFLKPKECAETQLLKPEIQKKLEDEKNTWVLKGALSYSGQAVIRGCDLIDKKWALAIKQALVESARGRPWIAQKLITVPHFEGQAVELGVYFLNGKPNGWLCRAGHEGPLSETSKEILRPVKIVK